MTRLTERRLPERTCVGCRAGRPKRELLRLVLPVDPPGAPVAVDPGGRRNGRGAYLCADHPADCLALARRRRTLPRAFRTTAERIDVDALAAALPLTAAVAGAAPNQEVSSSPR